MDDSRIWPQKVRDVSQNTSYVPMVREHVVNEILNVTIEFESNLNKLETVNNLIN